MQRGRRTRDAITAFVNKAKNQSRIRWVDSRDFSGQLRKIMLADPRNVHHEAKDTGELQSQFVAIRDPGHHLVLTIADGQLE